MPHGASRSLEGIHPRNLVCPMKPGSPCQSTLAGDFNRIEYPPFEYTISRRCGKSELTMREAVQATHLSSHQPPSGYILISPIIGNRDDRFMTELEVAK